MKIINELKFICFLLFILPNVIFPQSNKITKRELKLELANFLIKKEIFKDLSRFNKDNDVVNLLPLYHNEVKDTLGYGMYAFGANWTHSLSFFVLVDKNSTIEILDISTKKRVMESIEKVLDFGERNNFCSEIIRDYVNRVVGVYYNINKHPRTRRDPNCETGVFDTDNLP